MIVLSIVFQLWWLMILVSGGIFVANAWLYFVGMTQHAGLRDKVPDFRLCVRTIQLDSLTWFLYWRMERHIEHHMFAGVPCYNLKRLSLEIADDMPAPRDGTDEMAASIGALDPEDDIVQMEAAAAG